MAVLRPAVRQIAGFLALFLALLAVPDLVWAVEPVVLRATRPSLAFVFHSSGKSGEISTSQLTDALYKEVLEKTEFKPVPVLEGEVSQCIGGRSMGSGTVGRLHCLVDAARQLPGESRLLLTIFAAGIGKGEKVRLTALLIDMERAVKETQKLNREDHRAGDPVEMLARIESNISSLVVGRKRISGEVSSEKDARDFLKTLFVNNEFRSEVQRTMRKLDLGTVQLEGNILDATVSFNGVRIGQAGARTEIRNVPAGDHTIELQRAGFQAAERKVGQKLTERFEITLEAIEGNRFPAARWVLFSGGAAAVLAGVVSAAVLAKRGGPDRCFTPFGEPDTCPSGFIGTNGADKYDYEGDAIGSGPLLAPLGYSLVIGGLMWMLSIADVERWFGLDGWPWIELVAGIALGGAAYGISVAAN